MAKVQSNFNIGPGLTFQQGPFKNKRTRPPSNPLALGGGIPAGGQTHAGHADWFTVITPSSLSIKAQQPPLYTPVAIKNVVLGITKKRKLNEKKFNRPPSRFRVNPINPLSAEPGPPKINMGVDDEKRDVAINTEPAVTNEIDTSVRDIETETQTDETQTEPPSYSEPPTYETEPSYDVTGTSSGLITPSTYHEMEFTGERNGLNNYDSDTFVDPEILFLEYGLVDNPQESLEISRDLDFHESDQRRNSLLVQATRLIDEIVPQSQTLNRNMESTLQEIQNLQSRIVERRERLDRLSDRAGRLNFYGSSI